MKTRPNATNAPAEFFRVSLLRWFKRNRRPDPWRDRPTPYSVWVAEVMLQQTVVKTVVPHFVAWMKRFPDVGSLASASEREVLRQWEGLGYYSRARNLYRSANIVQRDFGGEVPDDYEELMQLPGIGDYTACAILSIAFRKPYSVVDANVRRVVQRFLAFKAHNPVSERLMRDFLQTAISRRRPGEFNESIMQLGQTVCRIRQPLCEVCPLRKGCRARALNIQSMIPVARSSRSIRKSSVVLVLLNRGRLLLQRNREGLFAGLWTLQKSEAAPSRIFETAQRHLQELGVNKYKVTFQLKPRVHSYTKFVENLLPIVIDVSQMELSPTEELQWVAIRNLDQYPVPVIHRKIIGDLLSREKIDHQLSHRLK